MKTRQEMERKAVQAAVAELLGAVLLGVAAAGLLAVVLLGAAGLLLQHGTKVLLQTLKRRRGYKRKAGPM